ncbi:MAG: FxsA family protein [Candidatus Omnitrophota bacterium]
MLGYLILLFTFVPAVELMVLIKVGGHIGALNTVFIIFLTGITGAYLARLQGFLVLRKIQENLQAGIMPTDEMLDGVLILAGGILLLTPGFITDTLGFLLLVPLTRSFIKKILHRKLDRMISSGQIISSQSPLFEKDNDIEDADYS